MKFKQPEFLVFILFFVVALCVYYATAGAGFITDQIGWFETYRSMGWKGIFNAFGDRSLHFIYHLLGYSLWRLFGFNGTGWMCSFVFLHSLVGTLSFHLFRKLFQKIVPAKASVISFVGALLFMLSPYQTEVLVWYACVHYLLCAALVLLALISFVGYLKTGKNKNIFYFYLFFGVAVFTLEISFSLPLILAGFILLFPLKHFAVQDKLKLFLLFVLPSLLVVAAYFVLSKMLRGSFAGHYGVSTHFNFNIALLTANLLKHTAKIFLLSQFWPHEKREALYLLFQSKVLLFMAAGSLAALAVVFLYRRLSVSFRAVIFLTLCFALALAPILNLYFTSIVNVEGDRFSYLASVFAAQLVSFLVLSLFNHVGWVILFVYLFFNCQFLKTNTESWKNNCTVRKSLLQNFQHVNAPHIFILNLPDNYKGTYMFRTFAPDNSFAETYKLMYGKDFEQRTTQVLSYNMISLTDSVTVEKISDNELKVTFAQWGNWWWTAGKGADSYSTEMYSVLIDEWSHSYNIQFKTKIPGAVYLYQCGGEWRQVVNF
jgi:hypothetical protein